ncbi:hypothetical protein Back2_17220 [Nocardioides baekrokdamisoli]|uniref:CsbD-like domain-containing protein n=1 Tax=Nocardioides baekrokdamisoli TaxID=1804624 RepID=A0A3G9IN31_9ACTN|nr:CsbD family protein [Nocardioides baekrokdamisoli]BBH17435.1 hypothetical protein Back2_17220 [Nocardioides baekrokdamisoli]
MNDQSKNSTQRIAGRAKEAAGVVVDDDDLKAAGRADQRKADLKDRISRLKDRLQARADEVR